MVTDKALHLHVIMSLLLSEVALFLPIFLLLLLPLLFLLLPIFLLPSSSSSSFFSENHQNTSPIVSR